MKERKSNSPNPPEIKEKNEEEEDLKGSSDEEDSHADDCFNFIYFRNLIFLIRFIVFLELIENTDKKALWGGDSELN